VREAYKKLGEALEQQGWAAELDGTVPVVTSRPDLELWRAAAPAALGRSLLVMGQDIRAEIKTLYHDPEQLGQDRVANVLAVRAGNLYPCLILDAGTCLTADVLDGEGVHLGGAIAAGGPALLRGVLGLAPHLAGFAEQVGELEVPGDWGQTTEENLELGWEMGLWGIADALVERYWHVTDEGGDVILTGGDARCVEALMAAPGVVMPLLTLEGLRLAWEASA
jgi:type III pantothenate kinase